MKKIKSVSEKELEEMDKLLGLGIKLLAAEMQEIPEEIIALQEERNKAREAKEWSRSDQLRTQIESLGYIIS